MTARYGPDRCEPVQSPSDALHAPLAGCVRCAAVACPVRAHDRRDAYWRECWHDFDRDDAHALGDHRYCLPGDALPLPDTDPHGQHDDTGSGPDACRWAALWRAPVLALAATLPTDRPLGVLALNPTRGPVPVSAHESYRTAGPARTATGRRPGDDATVTAKARAVVVCSRGHLH